MSKTDLNVKISSLKHNIEIPVSFAKKKIVIHRVSQLMGRLVTMCLILIIFLLTSFFLWVTFSNYQDIKQIQSSSFVNELLDKALLTVYKEESLYRQYQIEPSFDVRANHKAAASELIAAFNAVRAKGNATEQALVDEVLATHQSYLTTIERLFDAVDAKNTGLVKIIDEEEDLLLNKIVGLVNQVAQNHRTRAEVYLAELETTHWFIFMATPVVLIFGLGLIAFSLFLLQIYRRQSLQDKLVNKELQTANQSMTTALEQEKDLNELKSHFVTIVSHEFRTPLTGILSTAELLKHYSHKWTAEKKNELFDRIQTAGANLTRLLDDVLLIGKAEAGNLEFQPSWLDLSRFCTELLEELQLSTTNGPLIHFVSGSSSIEGSFDRKLLRLILNNLLSNSVKYSPQGGTIYFELTRQANQVVLQISDQGIGIPLTDQPRLFENFHRASNVGTIPGTGLGLAIVKKAVDAHGGQLTFSSESGVGTTFTVILPLEVGGLAKP